MKTILFLSHSATLSGAPLLLRDIAALLDQRKYRLCFILGGDGPLVESFDKLGPTYISPLFPDEPKYWRELKRMVSRFGYLREIKPDLMYCNTIHTAKWLVYARLLGIPTLTHVHELSMGFAGLSRLEHTLVKNLSGAYIAVSDAVKRYLVEMHRIRGEDIHVIRAGIDLEKFSPDRGGEKMKQELGLNDCTVIGTVGRITHMKGSDLFLELAALLKASVTPGTRLKFLVLATTEDLEFYKKFLAMLGQLGLQDDVIFLENIEGVKDYFGAMDIYISTAREDPFPLVVLEAMACRKPVVGFAVGGIPEMITDGCGTLVDGINLQVMCQAVMKLIREPDQRVALGSAARVRVEKEFDLSRNIKAFESVIEAQVAAKD